MSLHTKNIFHNQELVDLILKRIASDKENIKKSFDLSSEKFGIRFVAIDNLLPPKIALEIFNCFPKKPENWREMKSFRESKLTSKAFDKMPELLGEMTFAIQHPDVISLIQEITGMTSLKADPGLYAGGLSMMRQGDFLGPHIDNSHEQERRLYRRLNLLYYVSLDWELGDGGHLELWDKNVSSGVTIESKFNRLVLMETNSLSWHSVSSVQKEGGYRCCVSNYYFSPDSPLGYDYYHVTSFHGRPDEPFKRIICKMDNFLRSGIRKIIKGGLGKKDVYEAK